MGLLLDSVAVVEPPAVPQVHRHPVDLREIAQEAAVKRPDVSLSPRLEARETRCRTLSGSRICPARPSNAMAGVSAAFHYEQRQASF